MHPGARVADRYVIEGELGRGGMGAVYVATDEKFGVRVALKISGAGGVSPGEFRERFAREARLGNRLGRAAGFVRAFDWGTLPGTDQLYLAMDLVEGAKPLDLRSGALGDRLRRLAAATRLVASLHAQGVIHRDLKPQNFLAAGDGSLWLTDFGLGKLLGEAEPEGVSPEGLTRSGLAMGTPLFMAPEQFEDTKRVDARADVYALGVMLFVVLTGRLPFEGTLTAIMHKQVRVAAGLEPLPRPAAVQPGVPGALDEICARAIAVKPELRTADAGELVASLEAFLAGAPPATLAQTLPGAPLPDPATVATVKSPSDRASRVPQPLGPQPTIVPLGPGAAERARLAAGPAELARLAAGPATVARAVSVSPTPPKKGSGFTRVVCGCLVLSVLLFSCCMGFGVWYTAELAKLPGYRQGVALAHAHPTVRSALGGEFEDPTFGDRTLESQGHDGSRVLRVTATLRGPRGATGTLRFVAVDREGQWLLESETFTDTFGNTVDLLR